MDKTFKVRLLKEMNNKLKQVTDAYVIQVTKSAELWMTKIGEDGQNSFTDITLQLDKTIMFVQEKTWEFESEWKSLIGGTISEATSTQSDCAGLPEHQFQDQLIAPNKNTLKHFPSKPAPCDSSKMMNSLDEQIINFASRMSNMEKVFDEGVKRIKALEETIQQVKGDGTQLKDDVLADVEGRIQEKIQNVVELALETKPQSFLKGITALPSNGSTLGILAQKSHTGFTSCFSNISVASSPFDKSQSARYKRLRAITITCNNFECKFQSMYSATVEGIYEVSITLMSYSEDFVAIHVMLEAPGATSDTSQKHCVCKVWTGYGSGKKECTSTKIIKMSVGDTLYVQSDNFSTNKSVNIPFFSCVLMS